MRKVLLLLVIALAVLWLFEAEAAAEPLVAGSEGGLVWAPANEDPAEVANPPTTLARQAVFWHELNARTVTTTSYVTLDTSANRIDGNGVKRRHITEVWHPFKIVRVALHPT